MEDLLVLGIDCGGTHTDAAVLSVKNSQARVLATGKTATRHDNLPLSIAEAVKIACESPSGTRFRPERVTLGTTLAINALVQGKADNVGLALSAGPGLDPSHFVIGEHYCIVPGGLDHRGMEVTPLFTEELQATASSWPDQGVSAIACVGKFSPRNPAHEDEMARVAAKSSGLPVTLGHLMSGQLNFPRRVATAYYNAAVARIHSNFLDAVEGALNAVGIDASLRLLKADGGAIPFALSRKEPAQSILSGPAASIMGVLALWPEAREGCALLLDMGGTTTDIGLFLNGSPVVDRRGMAIQGRRTLVRSLASVSIGIGGDSLLHFDKETGKLLAGPVRMGPAMAFGGEYPTLLDALNVLDGEVSGQDRGDVNASIKGLKALCNNGDFMLFAQEAVDYATGEIVRAVYNLVEGINSRPIYTIAVLKAAREARPALACLAGGPAECMRARLAAALGMPVQVSPYAQVANAIGAALAIPTASLEVYADTGKGELSAPAYGIREKISAGFSIDQAEKKACELLSTHLASEGIRDVHVEVTESDLFATLDDYGRGAKDMRVSCQVRPGIVAQVVDPA